MDEFDDVGNALFGVEMTEADSAGTTRGKDNGAGGGGCKAAFLEEDAGGFGGYGMALVGRESRQRQHVRDGGIIDGKVYEMGISSS